jgi:hypothetical protein
MLFCATSPGLYSFFTNKAYPTSYFPFPIEVVPVPTFATCQTDHECKALKATHACNQKARSDIVTMNEALLDIFSGESTQGNTGSNPSAVPGPLKMLNLYLKARYLHTP